VANEAPESSRRRPPAAAIGEEEAGVADRRAPRSATPRSLLAVAATLLGLCLVLPLWHTRMEAPQYKGDEALQVTVYATRVAGDLKELHTLNQYVGVELPLQGPELALIPWVIGSLFLAALLLVPAPEPLRRRGTLALLVVLLLAGGAGFGVLQFRLWEMGHERGEQIFEGVDDFTPPVLGHIHVANFDATMRFGLGGWGYVAAVAVLAWAVVKTRRSRSQTEQSTSSSSERAAKNRPAGLASSTLDRHPAGGPPPERERLEVEA